MPTLDEFITDKKTYSDDLIVQLADGVTASLKDLRGGYLKDADYRRKTADLARQREEFEREKAQNHSALLDAEAKLESMARDLIQQNPRLTREEVGDELADNPQAQKLQKQIDDLKGVMEPLAKSVVALDQRLQDSWMQQMAEQHRRVLAYIKNHDPDLDENELVEFAKTRRVPRLDDAYRALKYEEHLAKARKEGEEVGMQRGFDKAKVDLAAPVIPIRTTPTISPDAPKTMDEALTRAYQDKDVMAPLLGLKTG